MNQKTSTIAYRSEPDLTPEEFCAVLEASGLSARRPVQDAGRIKAMLRNADLIVTARDGDRLVGVARAVTDFSYCCYLSDLAVDRNDQRQGIGRRLIEETHRTAGEGTTLVLVAAPGAEDFYEHAGLKRNSNAFVVPRSR